ncbi:MAG: response regulator [Oscillospiraceae bacterium]|nr:response regulator [Oscillospiraceae bacterium]
MLESNGGADLLGLQNFLEQMPGGFFVYRADETEEMLYVNDVLLDIFGCETRQEFWDLTGGTFRGLVYPDDRDAIEASITAQVAESERNLDHVEYRITRKDGAVRWVDDYGRFAHTKDAGDVYFVLIRDITELHEARAENVRRAEVIEGLSVDFKSIYLVDLQTGSMRPYRMNSEYFQAISAELGGADNQPANWSEILPIYADRYVIPADRERYLNEISAETIRKRLLTEHSYTVNYRCKDVENPENMIYMQMSVVLIPNGGSVRRVVVGYRDITEETMRVQREMSDKMRMELELEREKNANEVKSAFLFNLSHDIRTPMNAIMGFTDLAKRHISDAAKLKDFLEKSDEASRHLLSLIDDLLEMSKLDAGHTALKAEPCDLREQLTVTLDMIRIQADKKGVALEEKLDLPDGQVMLDAGRFRRVMGNLLDNAVKFTPEGGTVTLSAQRKQVSESGYARHEFVVADNGIGMSKSFMERLYQKFERESSSTKSGQSGMGLGLSIAKHLLDVMGGSISVESVKGKGTSFTVDLPMKLVDAAPVPEIESAPESAAGDGLRILLVEDIEINRMLAETILEEAGFAVESAPDGCDAVEMFAKRPAGYYDLVLMDIQMPVMNGYEATRAIRGMERDDAKIIPVIALSANARDEDKRMSMQSGMNNHIAKPFDVANLISTINEYASAAKNAN